MNIYKSVSFLCFNDIHIEKDVREIISFTVATKSVPWNSPKKDIKYVFSKTLKL